MYRFTTNTIISLCLVLISILAGCKSVELTSAKLYMQQENYPKAIEFLEKEATDNPTNAEAYYLLGYCYAQRDQIVEMDKAFKASVKISDIYEEDINQIRSRYWLDYFNTGIVKMQDGKTKEAIEDFKTAILIDSTAADAYKNLAHAQKELKNFESAIKNYEIAHKLEPYNRMTIVLLGKEYISLQKYPEAIKLFNKLIELDHGSKEGLIHITYCHDKMGDREKAITMYNDAIEKNDHDPDLFFNRGRLFFMDENFEFAIKDFSKIIEFSPEDFEAIYLLGSSFLQLGEKSFNEYLKLTEQNADTTQITVLKKIEAQNIQKARFYLERANKINSNNSDLWHKLGIVYNKLALDEESKQAYEKATELKKNEPKKK